jgi:hypothetical protein
MQRRQRSRRGQAIVTISRVNNYYGALVPVQVTANGAEFASLGLGATFTGGIKPGPVTLTTSMWSTPGSYTIHFDAVAGKHYAFELQPRTAGLAFGLRRHFGFGGRRCDQ